MKSRLRLTILTLLTPLLFGFFTVHAQAIYPVAGRRMRLGGFLFAIFIFLGGFAFTSSAYGATPVYYSVGQSASDLKTGTPTVTIASGVATFSAAQTGNIGVGDRVTYNTTDIAYIASKTSTSVWNLVTKTGAIPADITDSTVVSIKHEYTSLSAAVTGSVDANHLNTTDLVTGNYQLNFPCYYDSAADTTAVTVSGYTTGVSNFIKIYTPNNTTTEANNSQRHQGKWDDGKYRIESSAEYGQILEVSEEYVTIDGLQIANSGSKVNQSKGIRENMAASASTDIKISNNIIRATGSGTPGAMTNGIQFNAGRSYKVWNNIIYGWYTGMTTGYQNSTAVNHLFYNNTLINNTGIGLAIGGGAVPYIAVYNNISSGNGTDFSLANVDQSGNNISFDATSPNVSFQGKNVSFADATNKDFHLSISDTSARNSGSDLSADSNLPITTDIDGQARPTGVGVVDIGADEAATAIFYSVGQNTNDHKTGTPTVTIASGVGTFSVAQTATNMGVGDKVTYNGATVAYISEKISTSQWKLITATGGVPADSTGSTVVSIAHAFVSFMQAIGNGANAIADSSHLNTANLVTGNYQVNLPGYYDTGAINVGLTMSTNLVTSSSNYIKMYAPSNTSTELNQSQRHQGKWDDSKFAIDGNFGFSLNISNTIIDGIQFNIGPNGLYISSGAKNIKISSNIIKSSYGANYGIRVDGAGTSNNDNVYVLNNIIYGCVNGIARYYDGGGKKIYVYNNIVYGSTANGIRNMDSGVLMVAKNNIVQNVPDGYVGNFDAASNYNISDLATDAPGANSKNSTTVSFVDTTNKNFHLASTDTAAKGAGLDLQHDSIFAFDTDIDGQVRVNPWDIGADQFSDTVLQTQQSSPNLDAGLVGHWTFDGDDTSGTVTKDVSGNGNNGTISGATVTPGKLGQGMSFGGVTNVVSSNTTNSGNFTVSAWIKTAGSGGASPYIATATNNAWYWIAEYGGGVMKFYNGTAWTTDTSKRVSDGAWHYVSYTGDGTNIRGYIDGVLDTTDALANPAAMTGLQIGRRSTVFGYVGIIDDFRLYNRALSASEIGQLYNQGQTTMQTSQNSKSTNGLVGLWSFDGPDIFGTTAYDRSGLGNNGTISGATVTPGKVGQGLIFDGVDGYVEKTDNSSFDSYLQNLTISGWVKTTVTGESLVIGQYNTDSNGRAFALEVSGGKIRMIVSKNGIYDTGTFSQPDSVSNINNGSWHYFSVTYHYITDGTSQMSVYIDGNLETSISNAVGPIFNSSAPLRMGRSANDGIKFAGQLDEVRIYNRALSAAEISNLYNTGKVEMRR